MAHWPRPSLLTITAGPIGKRRYSARLPESAVTVLGCFGALERVVRTVANSPKRKETDGGIQRALPGWGPANRTAQIRKNPKATARKRIEQPRKSSVGAEHQRAATCAAPWAVSRPALADGDGRGPLAPTHTHRPDLEAVGPVVASERKRRGEQASY